MVEFLLSVGASTEVGVRTFTRGGGERGEMRASVFAARQPMSPASPSPLCLPSPLPPPPSPSLPSQEVDCHGNVVQERVEQAMEEIKDRLTFLEKRGRAEVGEELEAKYPCTCTDCDL